MPKPSFTWQEVAQHNKEGDLWVSLSNKVYDLSKFADVHPGGKAQILVGSGHDVTQVFGTYHKPDTIKQLEKFYIGEIHDNELPSFPPENMFATTLKQRVFQYFKDTKQDPKYAPWMLVRYAVIVVTLISSFVAQMYFAEKSAPLALLFSVILGSSCALIGLMPLHDASHFTITHSPLMWKAVGSIHDFLNGASLLVWTYQHTMGHHPYTNIDDADPDIMTSAPEIPDIRRIKSTQHWFWRYLKQHMYVPILYGLLSIKTRLQDVSVLLVLKKNGSIRTNDPTPLDLAIFIGGKTFFVLYRFLLPMLFVSPSKVLFYFFISDLVSSYYLALSFQCSHVAGNVSWPLPDKNGKIHRDWAELQIETTVDYATDSWFWTVMTGALNHQTVHHIFPGVSQYFYFEITPILVKTCKEFGVKYNYVPTFTAALMGHINYLRDMGQDPKAL